ncbi:MAG: hypothetical protein ABIR81_10020, partial [Ginsengibacter sp.]
GDDNVTVKTDNTTLEPQTKTASSSAKFKEQNNISPQKLSPSKKSVKSPGSISVIYKTSATAKQPANTFYSRRLIRKYVKDFYQPADKLQDSDVNNQFFPALFLQTPGLRPVNMINDNAYLNIISKVFTPQPETDSSLQKTISKLKKEQRSSKSFFISLLAGPDISTIKFQKVTHTGVNIGVMAGYRFSKKFSLQSGLIYNKKTYYSEGQYFNTQKLYLPQNYEIKTVDGSCRMYEVPLIAGYSLSSNKNCVIVNVGISSYLMKGENYDYFVIHNGYGYSKSENYKSRSVNIAAAAIGGLTLQNKLTNSLTLNLEPYFKIPLKGVGVGALPITSGGLNISLTKNFK